MASMNADYLRGQADADASYRETERLRMLSQIADHDTRLTAQEQDLLFVVQNLVSIARSQYRIAWIFGSAILTLLAAAIAILVKVFT